MAGKNTPAPEQETRGGDRIDWGKTEPGKPLPKLPSLEDQVPAEPAPRDGK